MVKNFSTGWDVESKGESEPILLKATTYILESDGKLFTDIYEHMKKLLSICDSHLRNYFWMWQREIEQVGAATIIVGELGHHKLCVTLCLLALGPGQKVTTTVYGHLLQGYIRCKEAQGDRKQSLEWVCVCRRRETRNDHICSTTETPRF